jgi:hypothetical protein
MVGGCRVIVLQQRPLPNSKRNTQTIASTQKPFFAWVHIGHICKATQANTQPKLCKRKKSNISIPPHNNVLYRYCQVKADFFTTIDNFLNYYSYH